MRCISWKKDVRSCTEEDSDSDSISGSCGRRILLSIGRRGRMTRSRKEEVGKRTKRTSMFDLPADLEQAILTRVPITSLRAVRSTCKLWDALTKEWLLGKAAREREHQFLGFMTYDSKVCSVRFDLCRRSEKEDVEYLLDLSIKQVGFLDQVKISRVLHCDGLLLCVADDPSRLMMWNPYLRQTKWIECPSGSYRYAFCYALGYDINRNHKILRFLDVYGRAAERRYEIYEFSSNSWRVLKVTPNWTLKDSRQERMSLSVKGNNYFHANESRFLEKDGGEPIKVTEYFLVSFDFTTERFGPRLPLPFHTGRDVVAFSCLKEEKIAVLYHPVPTEWKPESFVIVQIWVTNTIEPDSVSWSPFLIVEVKPFACPAPFACTALRGIRFSDFFCDKHLFIDEENKIAVAIHFNAFLAFPMKSDAVCQHAALVIGEGGYLKAVSLGEVDKRFYGTPPMWSSSYLPSLVQLNQG